MTLQTRKDLYIAWAYDRTIVFSFSEKSDILLFVEFTLMHYTTGWPEHDEVSYLHPVSTCGEGYPQEPYTGTVMQRHFPSCSSSGVAYVVGIWLECWAHGGQLKH